MLKSRQQKRVVVQGKQVIQGSRSAGEFSFPTGLRTAREQLRRTSAPFSTTHTETSRPVSASSCLRRMAAERPAGPAPTMTTSYSMPSRSAFIISSCSSVMEGGAVLKPQKLAGVCRGARAAARAAPFNTVRNIEGAEFREHHKEGVLYMHDETLNKERSVVSIPKSDRSEKKLFGQGYWIGQQALTLPANSRGQNQSSARWVLAAGLPARPHPSQAS